MPQGIIIKGVGGIYTVKCNSNTYECKARGVFRKDMIAPVPGDYVELEIISEIDNQGVITEIKNRKNQLIRPAVSNIDQLALFVAVKSPEPDLFLVDKLIVSAFINNIEPILCINKCDLDDSNISDSLFSVYSRIGIKTVKLSAINNIGISDLRALLPGKITAFAGQSGAGKSTALNAILGRHVMETGTVSKKQRGRHTTRHAQLFEVDNGYIADSPGFSNYDLENIELSDLMNCYPEFNKLDGQCRFRKCVHINEPDCVVKEAVDKNLIDVGRYNRYLVFAKKINEREAYKYK